MIRLRPISYLPRISLGLTIASWECGGPLQSVKPWRIDDVLQKPLGRRAGN
ncbi:MAG: hypothetical protein WBW51_04975 [Methyloceanibacter sp.]